MRGEDGVTVEGMGLRGLCAGVAEDMDGEE